MRLFTLGDELPLYASEVVCVKANVQTIKRSASLSTSRDSLVDPIAALIGPCLCHSGPESIPMLLNWGRTGTSTLFKWQGRLRAHSINNPLVRAVNEAFPEHISNLYTNQKNFSNNNHYMEYFNLNHAFSQWVADN